MLSLGPLLVRELLLYAGGAKARCLPKACATASDLCACMWRQGHRVPPREEAGAGVVERPPPLDNEFTISRCAAGVHRACARGTMLRAHRSPEAER